MTFLDVARQATAQLMLVSPPRRQNAGAEGFYEPPAPLPDGRPGDLIRAEPVDAYLAPGVRLRARAWRILYRSTGATGDPTAVSGTVLLPRGRAGRVRPLIGYAIGTHGIGDAAAPSRLLPRGLEWEAGLMALALARGWAVAITDYQGLGTPGDHTYMVGRALGPNVLDAMRAARALSPLSCPSTVRRRSSATRRAARPRPGPRSCNRCTRPTSGSRVSSPAPPRQTSRSPGRASTGASSRSSSPTAGSATPPPTPSSISIPT